MGMLQLLISLTEGQLAAVAVAAVVGVVVLLAIVFAIVGSVKGKHGEPAEEPAEEPVEESVEEKEEPAKEPVEEEPEEEPVEEKEEPAEAPVEEEPVEEKEEPAEEPVEEEPVKEEPVEKKEGPAEAPAEEPVQEEEPEDEVIEDVAERTEDEVAADEAAPAEAKASEAPVIVTGNEIAVKDMSPATRAALGLVGADEEKVYNVRYLYSFRARLALAPEKVQGLYRELAETVASYPALKRKESRNQERVVLGRNNVALFLFKGKKLCIALALDPSEDTDARYRGEDVGAKRRFQKTPLLLKVDSLRKLGHARRLVSVLADHLGVKSGEPEQPIEILTGDEEALIEMGEIRVLGREI